MTATSFSTDSKAQFQAALNPDSQALRESSYGTKVLYVLGIAAVIAEVVMGILHFQCGLFPEQTLLADAMLGLGGGLILGVGITIIYKWYQSTKVVPLEKMLKTAAPAKTEEENEHPVRLRCAAGTVAFIAILVLTAVGLIYFLQAWKWTPPDYLQSRVAFELSGVGGILVGIPLYHFAIYPLLKCLNR